MAEYMDQLFGLAREAKIEIVGLSDIKNEARQRSALQPLQHSVPRLQALFILNPAPHIQLKGPPTCSSAIRKWGSL